MKRESREARARAILGRRINLPVYRYCEFWLFGNNETVTPIPKGRHEGPAKKNPVSGPRFSLEVDHKGGAPGQGDFQGLLWVTGSLKY